MRSQRILVNRTERNNVAEPSPIVRLPPTTRYQGSKRKLLPWLGENFRSIEFDTALDLFGGTASVAYLLKSLGKSVTCNDLLQANEQIAIALVENNEVRLTAAEIEAICQPELALGADDLIARTFDGIYFTADENRWLDAVAQAIPHWPGRYQRALAYFALFQACLRKRPYNLFHRSNLALRTADVPRSFGNKVSWDRPFPEQFREFIKEANQAVFAGAGTCRAVRHEALEVPGEFDLVYIDPPYVPLGKAGVDYRQFYHFLEGLVDYPRWGEQIDLSRKHRPLRAVPSPWTDSSQIPGQLEQVFARYRSSVLAVSYRSDGVPSPAEINRLLKRFKRRVTAVSYGNYQYALSVNRRSRELLFVAR